MSEPLGFKNPRVQELRRLIGRRSSRLEAGAFVVEGAVLIAEAVAAGWDIEAEFVAGDAQPLSSAPAFELADGVLERVASTERPQPNLAVVSMPSVRASLDEAGFVLVADELNDPGNLGTILRSSEAAGIEAVVLTPGSVDPFNPKVVRASAGALFHVPVVAATLDEVRDAGLSLIGASSHQGEAHADADWSGRIAIVAGSEAHGLPDDAPIDRWVRIEHKGRAESLNVAMAATILVFEASGGREETPDV
ncbi:TrmH family RNA methyltransferase [Ilumatobacter sp.]|uniref:TrmH family RNA methyltransferase n=1 Tax=Ilumatobacter sp. TaxID=1967498 RepID=UPI003AF41CDF